MIVGPSESMSKSKKNTIDPETMIKQYGADAVRWFILSDSPPEKDVQWSDVGVASANKFLQKVWNLNQVVLNFENSKHNSSKSKDFTSKIEIYVFKIDKLIKNLQLNVAIAQFYEAYKFFNESLKLNLDKKTLIENLIKIMKLMIPFVPHIAHECLLSLKCKDTDNWPKINQKLINTLKINLVIQINGKTRDVIQVNKDLEEIELNKIVSKSSKAKKYIDNKKIIKTIYVKNKIINYLIGNK